MITLTSTKLGLKLMRRGHIKNVKITGICADEYPRFQSAYISSAEWSIGPLTFKLGTEDLWYLTENYTTSLGDLVLEQIVEV